MNEQVTIELLCCTIRPGATIYDDGTVDRSQWKEIFDFIKANGAKGTRLFWGRQAEDPEKGCLLLCKRSSTTAGPRFEADAASQGIGQLTGPERLCR